MQESNKLTRGKKNPTQNKTHQPLQGFQSRKLTITIETSHMTDFDLSCWQSIYSFFHCHKIYTHTAYSAANLSGALNEQMPAGLLPWHDIHDKLHLNLELASTNPMAQFQMLQDVKPNNLAPSLKIHTAYLGTNTVCTEQLEDICTIYDYK